MERNQWIPHCPHPRQRVFLYLDDAREVLFGGAARGGKTDALLMAAAQYLHVPGYAALILRRTFPDLMKADGPIPRSWEWWGNSKAKWNQQNKLWTFPCAGGGTSVIQFGYCDTAKDVYQYQGSEYHFVGWDELTQFLEVQYLYLFSRQSRPKEGPLSQVPLRVRAGSNPGGEGHEWVKRRFVDPTSKHPDAIFLPSRVADNPTVDQAEYVRSLGFLDAVTRAQLLEGDWDAVTGAFFRGLERIPIIKERPTLDQFTRICRFWDLASTEAQAGDDPDSTAGVLLGKHKDGRFFVLAVQRERLGPRGVRDLIRQTAELDGPDVHIRIEREGGASGKIVVFAIITEDLAGFSAGAVTPRGSKAERAEPWGSQIEAGNVVIVRDRNTGAFLDEHRVFPLGAHDDMVDAASGAFAEVSRGGGVYFTGGKP